MQVGSINQAVINKLLSDVELLSHYVHIEIYANVHNTEITLRLKNIAKAPQCHIWWCSDRKKKEMFGFSF